MIARVEADEPRAVDAEAGQAAIKVWQLVDVEEHVPHPVGQPVTPGERSDVSDTPEVQGRGAVHRVAPVSTWPPCTVGVEGACSHGGGAPSAAATSSPDRSPSSWNPHPV